MSSAEIYRVLKDKEVHTLRVGDIRSKLHQILNIHSSLVENETNPRSFGLVNKIDIGNWSTALEICSDTDSVMDFLRFLRKEYGTLRPFIEFVLLHVIIERSGKTFKNINQSIQNKAKGGILAERYIIWALNHLITEEDKIRVRSYIGPHELEPRSTAKEHPGLGCDFFLDTALGPGEPHVIFGVQCGLNLDAHVLREKIHALSVSNLIIGTDNRARGKIEKSFLLRHIPTRFMLFHGNGILSDFTDPDKVGNTIQNHMNWFNNGVKRTGKNPIKSLGAQTQEDLSDVQKSFSGVLNIWLEFEKMTASWSTKDTGTILTKRQGGYTYIARFDALHKGTKPIKISVEKNGKKSKKLYAVYIMS